MSTIEAEHRGDEIAVEDKPPRPRGKEPRERGGGKRPWYRRPLLLGILALILLAVIVGGVLWWLSVRNWETTDDAFIDTHPVQVGSQVAGRIARVLVSDNEDVAKGQVLLEIDPATFQARLDQATAAAAAAAGRLAQARAQAQVAAANLDEAKAEIGVAQANATNAARDLGRLQRLEASRSPALSRQQLDTALANAQSTAASLNAAQKKAVAATAQIDLAQSQIASAEADQKSAAAQVEEARLDLSYTTLKAPVAGHVTNLAVAVGNYIQLGQNLMALVPHTVWVTANFKETQLQRMRPGQPVDITIDAYPGKTFKGRVDSIQRGSGAAFSLLPPENATGNFIKVVQRVPVKIVFDGPLDPRYALGPGMSVEPAVKVR